MCGVEFARVNNEVWMPKHVVLTGSARVLLVKGYHVDADFTFSDYKKFSTESRVIEIESIGHISLFLCPKIKWSDASVHWTAGLRQNGGDP